ncbi:MAG: hypothetical protein JWO22_980 [Frankiales bacterium]|nr:hypothetical protein [Frankiales bacterium]
MSSRRSSLVIALTLVVVSLSAGPARAATAAGPKRLAGRQVETLRGSGPPTTRPALQRETTVVGGDPATTHYSTWNVNYVGSWTVSARAAFQRAVDQWASIIHSAVPIKVDAEFAGLGAGVLGSAGPDGVEQDPSLGDGVSYYPDPLADALAGTDVAPGYADIDAQFSSTEPDIYYGTDGNPPAGYIDFESVVLHELGHGLGFTGSSDYDSGTGEGSFGSTPMIFDRFLESTAGTSLLSLPNNSTALGSAYKSPVFWNGSHATAANGGSRAKMYAPSSWEAGSSIAHMDEATFASGTANSLMTPVLNNQEVVHRPGPVTLGIFQDMGYTSTLGVPGKVAGVTAGTATSEIDLSWTAPAENGSAITGYTVNQVDDTTSATRQLASSATSLAVTGLNDTHTYEFTVSAHNAVGDGAPSDTTGPLAPTTDTTPPSVSFTASPGAFTAASGSLGFTGSDPGHASAVLTFTCAIDAAVPVACTGPFAFSGLSAGTHSLAVVAKDASGNATTPAATLSFNVDATAPVVAIDSSRTAASTSATTASLLFNGSDERSAVTFRCKLDAGPVSTCTSPVSYSGLSNGRHTFSVVAVDDVGNQSATSSYAFGVDTVAPTVTANALPVSTLGSTVGLRYSGADSGSGIATYDVRYRKAAFNGAFGARVTQWHAVTATVETMPALKGYTYCFSVLSRDQVGQTSAWSPERCTATALDDRSLVASSGWTRGTSSAYYGSTVTSVAAVARTLTRTTAQARRVYLVATTCRGCGTVGVYWNGTLLRSVSLNAASTTYRHVISIKDFGAVRSGTLVIKTLSSGRTYVDGVTLSRA